MTTWEEAHNKPERSQYDQAQRPRASSGLNVADLLSSPPPMKRPKAKSLEGSHSSQPLFAHSPSKAGFGGTPTGTLPPSSGREAGPSKPSSPVSGSQSPSSRSHGAVTPSKSSRLVGGLPSSAVTIDSPPEAPAYQYASAQQILEGRENIEYILDIREQPKQSRMCGVGEKADRRPIDPAPIIQLRVITHPKPVRDVAAQQSDHQARQVSPQGKQAEAVSRSSESSLLHLRRGEPVVTQFGEGWEDKAWYLENPFYFMCAMLADAEKDEELHLLSDGKTRYTTGSCVSCLYHLKDIDGSHQGFFVFPDLSIRIEGRYRLKLCLFETIGNEVHHCKSIYSSPFMVYTAKRFPGMEESTRLSRTFADQGLKVRVRKNPRGKRLRRERSDAGQAGTDDDDDDVYVRKREAPVTALGLSQPKRLRSDSWLSAGSSEYAMGPGLPTYRPHQTPSPISPPQSGWNNGQQGQWHPAQGGHPGGHRVPAAAPPHYQRGPEFDPRRPSLPSMQDCHRPRESGQGVLNKSSGPWPPVNTVLPPIGSTGPRTTQGSPSAPAYVTAPAPRSRRSSPAAPAAPSLSGSQFSSPKAASHFSSSMSTVSSRQRSASSAAALSPRPWDARAPSSRPGPGLPSRFHPANSHAGVVPSQHHYGAGVRPGASPPPPVGLPRSTPTVQQRPATSRVHAVAHHRERSLSDPRKMMPPHSMRLADEQYEAKPSSRTTTAYRPPYDDRPTLPPLSNGRAASPGAGAEHHRAAYHHQPHGGGPPLISGGYSSSAGGGASMAPPHPAAGTAHPAYPPSFSPVARAGRHPDPGYGEGRDGPRHAYTPPHMHPAERHHPQYPSHPGPSTQHSIEYPGHAPYRRYS